ncbi:MULTISPECIES: isochorismate synthase [Heyndrickxia]|uniref:isochorismate synthase n=1 Tax=Heyndrickxia TaxID=2837504 RepID=UPI001FD62433|nr:isochorismate synthase [Heyndrickxia sporothermodurans]
MKMEQMDIVDEYKIALTKAKNKNKTLLFSYTEQLNNIDPLSFYSSAKAIFQVERFFWKVPNDEMIIVGLGSAHTFQTEVGEGRFEYIEREWNQFIHDAHVYNPFDVQGTGPVIFGGFSFDPLSMKESEWTPFYNALFHLPKLMLIINKQEVFLTTNILCHSNDNLDKLNHHLKLKREIFEGKVSKSIENINIKQEHELNQQAWIDSVAEVVDLLKKEKKLNKVVMARKMNIEFNDKVAAEKVLENLWEEQHESYIFALETENSCFTGASPERLVKKNGNTIVSACLAGSIKRGNSISEDEALAEALFNDEKNRHEHQLVVSMIAEVIRKYCLNVDIPELPSVMKMRDIQHLFTPVNGIIKDDHISIFPLVKDLHPTPAMGGVPTIEALQIIREKEKMDRGFYASPIGWVDYRGNGEFAVAIRSGLIKENEAFLYAGCGVVSDSNPEDEYFETKIKFRPMLRALGGKKL